MAEKSGVTKWFAKKIEKQTMLKAVGLMIASAALIEAEAVQSMFKTKTGTTYRKYEGTKTATWVASAPGEAPAVVTSTLVNSIASDVTFTGDEVVARIGTNVLYGFFLERGVKGKIEPRPWLRPAFMKMLPQIRAMWNAKGGLAG